MIDKIIDFSIHNKAIIGLFTLFLLLGGIWSMTQVPIDAVPDITNNQVQVITQSANLGTEDIEQFVTYPIEVALGNLPHVREIRSISRSGLSLVTVVFDDAVGTYLPRQLVAEKLPQIQQEIPEGFGAPYMGPISTGLGEIYQYTLEVAPEHRKTYSVMELRTLQDWIIARQMAMVPGVVEVNAFGGESKQYEVAVNPKVLRSSGVTITEVFTALQDNNQNTGGAYIERDRKAIFVRGEGMMRDVADIENTVVKTTNGIPVLVKDIGQVRMGTAIRYGALTKNGEGEAVGGTVMMLKDANSNEVVKGVKERMALIQQSLPEGISIVPFLDRSDLIANTTDTVTQNLMEGGLIVILVLVLLLGNWRGGLIVASTIPLSLLFAFICMHLFGVSANLMSLGAIDFGIIVDGAVIIVESTVFLMYRKLRKDKLVNGPEKDRLTASASKNMMNAAFFGQLIILIVFVPILALEGIEGKMFRPMALTFIFAMLGAMVLCLTYVPMVSALFLRPSSDKIVWGERLIHWITEQFKPLLQRALGHKRVVIGFSLAVLVLAVFTFNRLGGEFIPTLDEGDIAFHVILKPGSSLSETIATTTQAEQLIMANFPEAEQVVSRIGQSDVPTDPMPMDIADCFIILKPKSEWVSASSKEDLIEKIKETVSVLPGVGLEFSQPIEMRFNELMTGVRQDVAVKLYGEDLDVLARKAREIERLIANIPGVADLKVEATTGLPQINIRYDREQLATYGLQIKDLNRFVESAFAGGAAGVVFEGEKRFDLVVRFQEAYRQSMADVKNLYLDLPNGAQLPLRELAEISFKPGPMQISRDNTNRRTYVGINIRNRDVQSVVQDIQKRLREDLSLPPGYFIRYGGAFENLERATSKLRTLVPVALLLIFILIYLALRSLGQTMIIYLAIPLATIGGVFALWARDMPFSISAGVGFIVLFGVAVLNGLVMVNGLNELKAEGVTSLKERILRGTSRRIRPITLTALTDILGFVPMAISTTAGAEVQRPLATVVIGGLVIATLLTLFILPILYHWLEEGTFKIWPRGTKTALATFALLFFGLYPGRGQQAPAVPISMEDAVAMARENYPALRNQALAVERQEVLKGNANALGNTQIYTGGEEIGDGGSVYTTIGLGQQNMAVFSIGPVKKWQQRQLEVAQAARDLSVLELEQQVRTLWAKAHLAQRTYRLYQEMDTVYAQFNKTIDLNFEVEAISQLERNAAKNEILQNRNKQEQAYNDLQIALQDLNLWLFADRWHAPSTQLPDMELFLATDKFSVKDHAGQRLVERQLQSAQAGAAAMRAQLLPQLSLQGGLQRVDGNGGFYSYQAGLSLPLLSGPEKARKRAAELDVEMAENLVLLSQERLKAQYNNALQQHYKWERSWRFYEEEALPLAKTQRKGALFAYREGAIDYFGFVQLMNAALTTELKGLEALENHLNALFALHYFKP
ncbi:CusA/CzcA family heavy metal efflux RND transporter [Maribacter sp. 2307ULW6-5]|uniref:CusA/CzcA family heavy metal efflux RND transporter n=1 Tax=Maribacter sp. 2307ULW6-5 TaxID=3386275 RepID=UPI0039BD2B54